jgi:hypothetical protein
LIRRALQGAIVRPRLFDPRRVRRLALGGLAAASVAAFAPAPARAQVAATAMSALRGDDATPTLAAADDAPSLAAPALDSNGPAPQSQNRPSPKAKKPAAKSAAKPKLGYYPGAQRLGLRGGPPALADGETPPPTIATIPPPPPRRPAADDKPFDPVGIGVGSLRLMPYLEQDFGWASNPGRAAGAQKGSPFEITEGGVSAQSDWSRNELRGSLKAGYTDYFATPGDDAPYANGVVDGRLDVARDLAFDAEGRFNIAEQTLASLGVIASNASSVHPLVETFGATLGGTQKFGDLAVALHGTLDSTLYENATLDGGVVDRLSTDDFNDWGLRARLSYQVSPGLSPFVELDLDARRYFDGVDENGYARDSTGVLGRAGATLAFTQKLTGEASLGYGERAYQDARLPDMRAPLIDASLIWSATPLTTITAKAQTSLADTTMAGASGAIQRAYSIEIAHELTRRFTLDATAGYTTDHYVGVAQSDSTASLGLRAEYHLSRDVVLKASATRQQYQSSAPNSNYIANVFMLGLRLQR